MSIQQFTNLVSPELTAMNLLIQQEITTPITLISDICNHIITSGGKRIRPLIVLLSAKAVNYQEQPIIRLATVIEFFHTSSLLHDDVIDNSSLRRGQKTAHRIWGSKASVLVGDFLFSKAFQLLVDINNKKILSILAQTSNLITQGEVKQLMHAHKTNMTKAKYLEIIHSKTASLFKASAQMGAVLAERPQEEIEAIGLYGLHLGNAFQMIDDILDYEATAPVSGKAIGNDLAEGKITLPLLHVLEEGNDKQKTLIQKAIQEEKTNNFESILQAIYETQAIKYTYKCAEKEIDRAITSLLLIENSKYRDALEELAHYTINRNL